MTQWLSILDTLKTEIQNRLSATVADFYCLPGHRLMLYAVLFIFAGMGVFGAFAGYNFFSDLRHIPLKFIGIHAWHVAATFTFFTIVTDLGAATLIRPWGSYDQRTVGKVWIILFAGFLMGFFCERLFTYKLIIFYDSALWHLWKYVPSTRPDALSSFFVILPIWCIGTAIAMRIIVSKQDQTTALLRVRLEAILDERSRSALDHHQSEPIHATSDPHLPLPTDPGTAPIRASQITHVTAEDHYLRIHLYADNQTMNALVRMPLKDLRTALPADQFVQIHRSHIVNLAFVAGLRRIRRSVRLLLKYNDTDLPVSRHRLPHLLPTLAKYLKPEPVGGMEK